MQQYLTVGDVCHAAGVSTRHVQRLYDAGTLRGYMAGSHRRIHRRSVVAYLRERGLAADLIPDWLLCDVLLIGAAVRWASDLADMLPADDFRIRIDTADRRVGVAVVDAARDAASWRARGAKVIGLSPEDDGQAFARGTCDLVLRQPVAVVALADAVRGMAG